MTETAQILAAITTQLQSQLTNVQCIAYLPDNLNPPTAIPWLKEVRYHGAMQGGDVEHDIVVAVIIPRQSERACAGMMAQFLSYSDTNSIRHALEEDVTLGGVVDTLEVIDGRVGAVVTIGSAEYVRLDFNVTVYP